MKFKLKSLGVKDKPIKSIVEKAPEPKVRYPSTEFSSKNIDGLTGLAIGDKVTMMLEAEVTDTHKGADWGTKEGVRVSFDLLKGAISKSDPKDMDEAVDRSAKALRLVS